MWAAARTLQAVFGVTYEIYSEARQLFLGAISKIGSGVDFRVCRDCVSNSVLRLPAPRPHERRPSRGLVFRRFPDRLEGPFGGSYEEWALKTAWSRQELGT